MWILNLKFRYGIFYKDSFSRRRTFKMVIWEFEKKENIYLCNHVICEEKSWLGKGFDWKMCEIVFGVHTKIRTKMLKETCKSVKLIRLATHFCRLHAPIYKDMIFGLLARKAKIPLDLYLMSRESNVIGDADFKEGLGCFITIHDCLTHEPIKNLQMPYDVFEKVVSDFLPIIRTADDLDFRFLQKIKNLKQMRSTANL